MILRPTVISLFLLFISCLLAAPATALWLSLLPGKSKCVSEELHSNVVVVGDYLVVNQAENAIQPTIAAKVTSPFGNMLHNDGNTTSGQFAFTTREAGNYLACFWLPKGSQGDVSVSINWKIGIAARDWESVARKEKIEGIELELTKLEGSVEAIHENLLYLKTREADMSDLSDKTNSLVARMSILYVGICIMASALQVWHLQYFFEKKKLI